MCHTRGPSDQTIDGFKLNGDNKRSKRWINWRHIQIKR